MGSDPTRLPDSKPPGVQLHRLSGTVDLPDVEGNFDVRLDALAGEAEVIGPAGSLKVQVADDGGDLVQRMVLAARNAHDTLTGGRVRLGHYEVHPLSDHSGYSFRFLNAEGDTSSVSHTSWRDKDGAANAALDDAAQHGAPAELTQVIDADA